MSLEITIRALNPCIIEKLSKDIDGITVEVERSTFDNWLDIWIDLPDGLTLPPPGTQFSLQKLVTDYEIEETSDDCDIEYSVITDIENADVADEMEVIQENGDWDDWKVIDDDLLITNYKVI